MPKITGMRTVHLIGLTTSDHRPANPWFGGLRRAPARHAPAGSTGRWWLFICLIGLLSLSQLAAAQTRRDAAANAQSSANSAAARPEPAPASSPRDLVLEARDAARQRNRPRVAAALAALQADRHALLPWADYWDLSSRLREATQPELEAFYQRWPDSYVEDRLRNEWLRELGRRRDWPNLAREYPRFKMADDREVQCWWLLTEHLSGQDVRSSARAAWLAQREADDGCDMLATALVDGGQFSVDDVWLKVRLSLEINRPAAARRAVGLVGAPLQSSLDQALENPAAWLRRSQATGQSSSHAQQELRLLALMRLSSQAPADAGPLLEDAQLSPAHASWAWAYLGRQAAFRQLPEAGEHYLRAASLQRGALDWSTDTLAWGVRSALRHLPPAQRWPLVQRLIGQMSSASQQDPAWRYWRAMATMGSAKPGAGGDAARSQARQALAELAGPVGFYNLLAADALNTRADWPAAPAPLAEADRQAVSNLPGLRRALLLLDLNLRNEARREWNYTLRGLDERQLLAAARLACERADWQLCINTAERSRGTLDLGLRYPMPQLADISAASQQAGVDLAFVLGLIRQETRFMSQLRSHVGATGLMQVMPETGRIVARRLGLACCSIAQLADPALNLRLGTSYLRSAMDEFEGSQALAAAAYNAGPGRPRRWREGGVVEAAAWAESIPFNETRDYVKQVLANAAVYQALLTGQPPSLRARLGELIGPKTGTTPGQEPDSARPRSDEQP